MDTKETGGTAISNKNPSPAVVWAEKNGYFNGTVIDYGAGYGRNSAYLRAWGYRVYSYDPYNGSDCDGWEGVSNQPCQSSLINEESDVTILTSYVINVVPHEIEQEMMEQFSTINNQVHIVRNDVVSYVAEKMLRGDGTIREEMIRVVGKKGCYTDKDFYTLAVHGYPTRRGYQRHVLFNETGFSLVKTTSGYRVFVK